MIRDVSAYAAEPARLSCESFVVLARSPDARGRGERLEVPLAAGSRDISDVSVDSRRLRRGTPARRRDERERGPISAGGDRRGTPP